MDKDEELLKSRIIDLADRSFNNNHFTFTDFLSLSEASVYYKIEKQLNYAHPVVWGLDQDCERTLIRFGNPDELGYEEDFPISILQIKPLMEKFSDDLTHRDILGSLMNLGIKRSVLGDIYLSNNISYVYCLSSIAEYICDNISRIKHTSVLCQIVSEIPSIERPELSEKIIQVQSPRIDGIISRVYNLSRSKCIPLFIQEKVFINGKVTTSNSTILKVGDKVTVRGFGRFTYAEEGSLSKKGKLNIKIEI